MGSRTVLDAKYAGETKKYTFDFVSVLAVGETISTQTVTATVYSGVDASPSAIISGAASASGTVVTQAITAGTAGNIYDLACLITTSASQTLLMNAFLTVIPTQP